MIVLNGISNPVVFGWELFITMEVLTLLVETVIITALLGDKVSLKKLLFTVLCMNILSALLLWPFWYSVAVGGY